MLSIARKNLFAEKTRFLVSISGVAFAILLMIFLMGVYSAASGLVTVYIEKMDTDIIVAQEGVVNMLRTFSVLNENKMTQIERITGGQTYGLVSIVSNVLLTEDDGSRIVDYPGRPENKEDTGIKKELNIVGFNTKKLIGGPWRLKAGSITPGKDEIVIDDVFARQNKLKIGDSIEAFGHIFKVSGITDQNNIMVITRAFVDLDQIQDTLKQKSTVNFILVKLPDPSQTSAMIQKLKDQIPGVSVYSRSEFAKSNGESITQNYLPIIFVITVLGFLTGAAIIGLLVYTSTLERLREFGILKAIGASNRYLFWVVFEQAFLSSIVGFIAGVILSYLLRQLVFYVAPAIPVVVSPSILAVAFISAVLMSLIASYIPVKRIIGLDPAMVFRQ